MKTLRLPALLATHLFIVTALVFVPLAYPQEGMPQQGPVPMGLRTTSSSPITVFSQEDKLHAVTLTRFHFNTLKQFHSNLYQVGEAEQSISAEEAGILNIGLNAFLTSPEREALLLKALRNNKAVQLKFTVPETSSDFDMVKTQKLVYRLKPLVERVPAVIEVRPILDGPIAFEIVIEKGRDIHIYDVNWSGWISGFPYARS